jgi:hypothetical protein
MAEVSQLLRKVNQVAESNQNMSRISTLSDLGSCLKLSSDKTYESNFKGGLGDKSIASLNIL